MPHLGIQYCNEQDNLHLFPLAISCASLELGLGFSNSLTFLHFPFLGLLPIDME